MLIASILEIVFAGLVVWIWFGARPSAQRFALAHDLDVDQTSLPPVRRALGRTYQGRVLGALIGAVLLGAAMLLIGIWAAVAGGFIGLLAGTMVGVALAQHRSRPDPHVVRHASLDARTIGSYAPIHATRSVVAASAACLVVGVLAVAAAPSGLGPFTPALVLAGASLLIVPIGHRLQRRIVEAPRASIAANVDDALRSTAVRTVHHAVLGVLLCGLTIAGLTGLLTQRNLTVQDARGTLFTAPPGATSISVDTGLRDAGSPNAPVRVYWIEADGTERRSGWMPAVGTLVSGPSALPWPGRVFSFIVLLGAVSVLVEWYRATSAWRRGSPQDRAANVTPAPAAGTGR